MGFGSGASSPPAPQPVTPVPQNDDPSSYEAQRKVATAAKERQGMSAQLLSSSPDSVSTDEQPRKTAATIG